MRFNSALWYSIYLFRGFVFSLIICTTAFTGCFVHLPITFLLGKWKQRIRSALKSTFFALAAFLIEFMYGVECYSNLDEITSTNSLSGANILMISNHRTRIDWALLWILFARYPYLLLELKITLKHNLRKIPLFGWAMRSFDFVFLRRSFQIDEQKLLSLFSESRGPTVVLLFPEGTDLSPGNLEKSRSYAIQKHLSVTQHVLVPRAKGFSTLLRQIKTCPPYFVLDVTMAFHDRAGHRPSEVSFFDGTLPSRVYYHARLRQTSDMTSESELADRLFEYFEEKEILLRQFYNRGWENLCSKTKIPTLCYLKSIAFWLLSNLIVCRFMCYLYVPYTVLWMVFVGTVFSLT